MRPVALLLLAPFVAAAPVPKPPAKSDVELTLSAETTDVLHVTIRNTGPAAVELPYRVTPLEHVTVTLTGDQGKSYTLPAFGRTDGDAAPGTLTIPAGESRTFPVHTCHVLTEVGEPGQTITFPARLKAGKRVVDAKPLTVRD